MTRDVETLKVGDKDGGLTWLVAKYLVKSGVPHFLGGISWEVS